MRWDRAQIRGVLLDIRYRRVIGGKCDRSRRAPVVPEHRYTTTCYLRVVLLNMRLRELVRGIFIFKLIDKPFVVYNIEVCLDRIARGITVPQKKNVLPYKS